MKYFLLGLISTCLIQSCQNESNDDRPFIAHNEELIKTYFNKAWNAGEVDILDSILDNDYINHTPSTKTGVHDRKELKTIIQSFRKAFPDLHFSIEDIIATNNRVVARVRMTGTHKDSLFGLPPTGKTVSVNQINIEQIENGRFTEHWRVTDELELMKQLGFVQ
ncbi:MAG TPA: ester cyclase [Chitinophagaceae bacterium]|jgi:steroid delta-isomerase-like uncharacterized protein|nr:ester cyclase [Chitinophagaceae bacterium]